MLQRYIVNSPAVVSETIDGEAVILNLNSGRYFNTDGAGAVMWSAIQNGATITALTQTLAAHFVIDDPAATNETARFVSTLLEHELVRTEHAEEDHKVSFPEGPRLPFASPVLTVHSDLDDLLLLDPVHDVAEAGWPAPKL
jgi:hypothetical protein